MRKVAFVLFLIICMLVSAGYASESLPRPPMPDTSDLIRGFCSRVVDGDTAYFEIVENGIPVAHSFRFIGVDTPETVHPDKAPQPYGKEASAFSTEVLLRNWVYIEYDIKKTDDYNRHLCYVWLEDGTLFNMMLLEKGYGKLSVYPPNIKYVDYFVLAQKASKAQKAGIWTPANGGNIGVDLDVLSDEELLLLREKLEEEIMDRSLGE